MHILNIEIIESDTEVSEYYKSKENKETLDSGFDIIFPKTYTVKSGTTQLVDLGIKCKLACTGECDGNHGYFLMPRSSIYKTLFRQSNSIGLIDSTYHKEIKVAIDILIDQSEEGLPYNHVEITKGIKLFQLVMPDAKPFKIIIVDKIEDNNRGGFGSTGK